MLHILGGYFGESRVPVGRMMGNGVPINQQKTKPYKLFIRQDMCPGDAIVATCAVTSLHKTYPNMFQTMMKTTAQAIWDGNPYQSNFSPASGHVIDLQYPAIHSVSDRMVHFADAVCENLSQQIGMPVPLRCTKPCLYLSEDESTNRLKGTEDIGQYIVGNFGTKLDFTAKFAGSSLWQKVVDHFKGKITFVQVGEDNPSHKHKILNGVVNFVGRTSSYRDLFRLCKHSVCGVGPVSMLLHTYAALDRPYVALAGARESGLWESWESTHYLHCFGSLPCAKVGGCWKSRTVALHDGNINDQKLCELPVLDDAGEWVPSCLLKIGHESVISTLEMILRTCNDSS